MSSLFYHKMMNKHKILILGAGEGQVPLIRRAKSAGWFVIVVSPQGDYPGFALAELCFFADITDYKTILQIAKDEQIEAIATDQTDISVPTVQYVAEELNLPHIDCEDVENFHYKSRMRSICQKAGLPTIQSAITSTLEEAETFFIAHHNESAIIKPTDSQGSRGVLRVDSLGELREAYHEALHFSKEKKVIIEQFIDGQEIEIDTIVKDGDIKGCLIGDVYNFDVKNTFSAYERIYPTSYSNEMQEQIYFVNAATLHALGMRTGWTHGEYIVAKDGTIYLIEVGARGGGNYIGSDIVRTMLGVGTQEMAFKASIGDKSFYEKIGLRNTFCAYKCFYLPEGEIKSIRIDAEYLKRSYVITHNLYALQIGMQTHSNTDKTSRYTVLIQADSREQLQERLADIPNHIAIDVKTNHGIEQPIWK